MKLAKLRRHLGASIPADLVLDAAVVQAHRADEKDDDSLSSAIEFAPMTAASEARVESVDPRVRKRAPQHSVPVPPKQQHVSVKKVAQEAEDTELARNRSRLWVREKQGHRWVADNYQEIVMELRMLR
jgi:hypothetical protein